MRRAALLLCAITACRSAGSDPSTHSAAPEHAPSLTTADTKTLRAAEARRDSGAIGEEVLSSRELPVRRAAARALARIADAPSVELLLLALSDEDPEVTSWAAYGLGYACRGREAKTVRALVTRAASLNGREQTTSPLANPSEAISDALGRCAGPEAESTLRAWLIGPQGRAEAAALALGRLATARGKLDDATLVALLEAADRPQNPLENALYPCTRLSAFNASTGDRVRALALRVIASKGPGLEFAVRALGRTGNAGTTALGGLLADSTLDPGLRAEAARELSALGDAGQRALWTAFDGLATKPPSDSDLQGESYGPLSALLDALAPPIISSGSKLQAWAELPLADPDAPTLRRRKVHVRCAAAALLAGSNYQSPRLTACDSSPESATRELSVLQVIGRDKLRGPRKQAYLARASAKDNLLREAAIGLLGPHAELSEAYRVLADALSAPSLGVVASAAQLLTSYPERAARLNPTNGDAHSAPNPDPSVVQALTRAYAATRARHSVEVQSLLLDAIGALQILSLKEAVNGACGSDNPTLREHAEKSLHLLGEEARHCDKFSGDSDTDSAALSAPAQITLLTLDTDAGSLTLKLDATFAPNAVARIVTLAQAGFYEGVLVHRVVPGFVAQFGDPSGDGYGGDDKPPLRCETSPIPFRAGSVGVALAGRDTGSSQLFVTLGRYPHLDGEYAWLGQAGPGWERVAAGDRIRHVTIAYVH
jgi:cyclophilin family peptidyl-prolyl cis-trans isomerase/HEAT repeat protein